MKWTSWPYWLKGGVIGGGVSTFLTVASTACLYVGTMSIPKAWLCIILLAPSSLTLSALDSISGFAKIIGKSQGTFPFSIEVIFIVLAWFVIGALIGSVFDLIKKRKSPSA